MTAMQRRALCWIEAYQRAFSGRPSPCRFYPSCSSYAHEAVVRHGSMRGGWLSVKRLLRCRPFGPSGFDPVPDPMSDMITGTRGTSSSVVPSIDVREVD